MRGGYLLLLLIAIPLHGLPWLFDGWLSVCMSWVALACGLTLAAAPAPWSRFWCLWIWCTFSIGIAFHWSPDAMTYTLSSDYWLGFLVAAPLIIWDGLRLTLSYWLGARICRQPSLIWLSTACCAILLEEFMPSVFPWRWGMLQLSLPWWLQGVDLFGAGWSTLMAFAMAGALQNGLNALMHQFGSRAAKAEPAATSALNSNRLSTRLAWSLAPCLLVANALYCGWSWQHWQNEIDHSDTVRMGLVQVDPSMKVSLQQLQELTGQIANDVELVCWPESSAGTYDMRLEEFSDAERNFAMSRAPERGLRPWPNPSCELLLAGKNYQNSLLTPVKAAVAEHESDDEPERLYVSAMLLDAKERIVARYHKRYLMPFGEYVPGENVVPGMAELFDMCEHVTPGEGSAVIESQTGARIGVMLCYEDMVAQAACSAANQHANVIVSLINGSAFASPVTLHQHRLLAHMRALETRKTFVRCAATGETCVISACGELGSRLPLQENGVLKCDVHLLNGVTLYSQLPQLLLSLVIATTVAIITTSRKPTPRL